MNGFLGFANEYAKQSDWKDLAMIKLCLCSIGVMIGMAIPAKSRRIAALIAVPVFICTYLPLIFKLLKIMGITGKKR